jgi:hypothetical protein
MCLRAAASASPFGVGSVWSVPCGTIFPRPCAGCGGLASAAKARIGPTCTTCAGQARNGTPNTAAWRKPMELAGQAGGPIAPTRTAPNVRYRHPSFRIGATPNLASRAAFTSRAHKPVSSGRHKPLIAGSSPATLGSRTVSTRLFSMSRYETATKQVDRMGLETWQFAARSSMTTRT